ncbi:MAG TPA: fibronectin type III domain-containing protein, partial [Nitrospira sp.]|nr:fibronectin type III domain-containing protein [Nitrospira sp.]
FTARTGQQTSANAATRYVLVGLPPAEPANLMVVENLDTRLLLQWDRNTEQSVVSYYVYRNGNNVPLATVNQVPSGQVSYQDLALTDGPIYTYTVKAVDQRGQQSNPSDPASAACSAGGGWGP